MLSALADLTVRGSLLFAAIGTLDVLVSRRMRSRSRRAWWWLAGLGFLLPLHLPLLPALPQPAAALNRSLTLRPLEDFLSESPVAGRPASLLFWEIESALVWIWAAGAISCLGVVALRTWRTGRRWSRERLCTDPDLLGLLEDSKAAAGVTAPIGLVLSSDVSAPVLLGWLRPRILMPAELAQAMSRPCLRAVLLHELAHFRAMDLAVHWIYTLVRAIHWFNPVAHFAARRWLRYRELAADEAALTWLTPAERPQYGEALLATLRHAHALPVPSGALALGESLQNLKHRIVMISRHASLARHGMLAFAVSLALAGLLVLQSVRAADAAAEQQTANDTTAATEAMLPWLQAIDAGRYEQSWRDAGALFRKQVTLEQWQQAMRQVREPLGASQTRRLSSASRQAALPPNLKGEFVIAQFNSSFENLSAAVETVTFAKEPDGQWRSIGYFIKPQ